MRRVEKDRRLRDMAGMPVGRLLLKYGWPSMVAMIANAFYSIVDRMYIGQGCGPDAIAALALTFPLMIGLGAFGVFVGAGHASLISIKLGEGDRPACEKLLGELVAFKLAFFVLLIPLLYIFLDRVLMLSGGSGVTAETFAQARTYLRIVLFSHVFSHLAFGLSASMRAEGAASYSMVCMLTGFGLNFVLDPIFIFVFDLGIAGAAWATVISMIASAAVAFRFYLTGRSAVKFHLGRVRFYRQYVARACGIGFGPFLQQILGAFINVSLQLALIKWAASKQEGTIEVAALGVFQAALILFIMPAFGIQQGLSPIIGYNWGARNYRRVREATVLGFWLITAIVTAAWLVQMLCPGAITWLFMRDAPDAFIETAKKVLVVSNCMLWCIGLNVTATTFFQAIGHPKTAIVLSTLRQGACLLPCIWILPRFFEDHSMGVWLSMPASDVLACLATLPPAILYLRFLSKAGTRRGR